MSLQHVVLLAFPDKLGTEDEAEMCRQVQAWPEAIGGISTLRFGSALSTDYSQGYQYLLFMEFPDQASYEQYLGHKEHLAFGGWIMERKCTPLVFDYVVDDKTVIV
ncbi:MAG TPA: Dabb family protein [Acidimicrobiales bacterium]|nr:Dabb family protein [Acidimicrobiales bacterium]